MAGIGDKDFLQSVKFNTDGNCILARNGAGDEAVL
jgi:hypothetical protein